MNRARRVELIRIKLAISIIDFLVWICECIVSKRRLAFDLVPSPDNGMMIVLILDMISNFGKENS